MGKGRGGRVDARGYFCFMKDPWPSVVAAALSGTGMSAEVDERLSPVEILAMARLLHRAAAPLAVATGRPLLPPLPDHRAVCPDDVVLLLASLVQQPLFRGVLPEFLALLEHRRWRLPPEWLPLVLDIVVKEKEKMLTPAVRRALGPLATWLAAQDSRWTNFFFPKSREQRKPSLRPARPEVLRVHWPALPYALWERCVLAWAQSDDAWASSTSALVLALLQSIHPWPQPLTAALWTAWERTSAHSAHTVPSHWHQLWQAAALRAAPEHLLDVQRTSLWPYPWQTLMSHVRDVVAFRARMLHVFRRG